MSCGVTQVDICRVRGDTFPFRFAIKDDAGAAVDITGATFVLTVDPAEDPAGSGSNLFANTPTIVAPASQGLIEVALTAPQAGQTPGDYFYDVQMLDAAGKIRTIARGKWQVSQDITKTP